MPWTILIDLFVKLLPWLFSGETKRDVKVVKGLEDLDRSNIIKRTTKLDLPKL